MTTLPNARAAGRVTAVTPVPVRLTDCGLLPALSAMLRVLAAATPRVVGAKVTLRVQLAPAATGVPTTQCVPVVPGPTA